MSDNNLDEILTRGVTGVTVKESLFKKLQSGKKLRIKLGIDPTGPSIHLGRAIPLRKLRDFQKMGHKAVLVVGDFTALIGDPSDKLEKRPMLTKESVKENMKAYKKIIGKILDIKKTEFVYNSKWLAKLKFGEIVELAEAFSVSQMIERRNFKDRIEKGLEISLREFMYPLMQGYDSVAINSDVELGGFDQLFNLHAGRTIQKHFKKEEQDIMTTEMLLGTDGRKMSTSWGNVIFITDEPKDMFGKIMSIRDEMIVDYFRLTTDEKLEEIENIKSALEKGANPKDYKIRLAYEIVKLYHTDEDAKEARESFTSVFSGGGIPKDAPTYKLREGETIIESLFNAGIESKTELKRLIGAGSIKNLDTEEMVKDWNEPTKKGTYKIGKHRFLKII
ncbi:MAG TPA: tyrosine--tRNA ligase [Candidatus Paceibacterota bacterium]|nr:tyrosine--tRNA ligase [Candidatus Paceibacterota bacterium]